MHYESRFSSISLWLLALFAVLVMVSAITVASPVAKPVSQPTEPEHFLAAMAHSFRETDYDGVLVFDRDSKMQSVRVVHVVRDGLESERVEYLDGDAREMVRSSHPTACVHPGGSMLSAGNTAQLFSAFSENGNSVRGQYSLAMSANSRVAGREVRVIDVTPNDEYRFARQLYLDKESHLLLRSLIKDSQGNVLESFQFSHIKTGSDVDAGAIKPHGENVKNEPVHPLPVHKQEQPTFGWRLAWVPSGFVKTGGALHKEQNTEQSKGQSTSAVQSVHYTDGLSGFSVFVEAAASAVQVLHSRTGGTTAYTTPKRLGKQWLAVTVVGEVPMTAAVKISQSVQAVSTVGQ